MLMIHIHFAGCQYIKRFIFFRAPDCQSTEGYLYICFSTQFFLYVLYNCIENSKTTVYFYDHEIKNYLLLTKAYKTLDSDAV